MNSKQQSKKSWRSGRIWTALQAASNRRLYLLRNLSRPRVRRRLLESLVLTIIGSLLYLRCMSLFFGVKPLSGVVTLGHLRGPLFSWGSLILLSILVGSWSVGGALTEVVKLCWKWVRLYEAGGK